MKEGYFCLFFKAKMRIC